MEKKKLLWVIDSLGRGGAEYLLVRSIPYLSKHFTIYLFVLFSSEDPLNDKLTKDVYRIVQLNLKSKFSLIIAAVRLKYWMINIQPDIIKSDLYYSNLLSRCFSPSTKKVFFTIHSILSDDGLKSNLVARKIEQWVYKSRHTLIAVSRTVLKDYQELIGIKGPSLVVQNFVSNLFLKSRKKSYQKRIQKIICVGNIKPVKNYNYLFKVLRSPNLKSQITIDIYGDGSDRFFLNSMAKQENLPIQFLGSNDKIHEIMHRYDAFLMPSFHEGFGIAAAEAMVVGLPVFLSDTEALVETSFGKGIYFNPYDEMSLVKILNSFLKYSDRDWFNFFEDIRMLQQLASDCYLEKNYMKKMCEILGGEKCVD